MWKSKGSETVDSASSDRPASAKTETAATRNSDPENTSTSTNYGKQAASADSRSHLGPSLQIKGEISGTEDVQLDCSVEGTVRLPGRRLTVGANAKIVANIVAGEAIILGHVKGNLTATDRIEIKKDGSVTGELTTTRIMIEDGAYFKGTIVIDRKGTLSGKESLRSESVIDTSAPLHISGGSPTLYLASAKDTSGA